MKITSARQDQGIPGVYGLLLLDVVSRWGYNDETFNFLINCRGVFERP